MKGPAFCWEERKIHKSSAIGVINGMYATTSGDGGIVPIQIYKNYNADNQFTFKMTGSQGLGFEFSSSQAH